jgi:hypothetical protein
VPGAVAGIMVAGLLSTTMAGCAMGKPARHVAARPAVPSAWQLTLDRVKPDGTVDTATALAAFALAIGPVPGARPPGGPAQVIPSGTIAVQWVLGHWSQLAPAQRGAVLHDLGQPTQAANAAGAAGSAANASLMSLAVPASPTAPASLTASPAANPNLDCLTADSAGAQSYRSEAAGIESDIAAHMGAGPFSPQVYFSVNTVQTDSPRTALYTWGCTGGQVTQSGGTVQGCTIHVNPNVSNFSASDRHDFLIHELTHCYMFLKLGEAEYHLPAWYVEGTASWTMTVLGNGTTIESSFWLSYLSTPAWSLFQRTYSALGFFAHLAETGTDVWQKILPMGQAIIRGWNAAGWQAAAPGQAFLDSWGPGYTEGRYPGTAWQSGGPNLPHFQGPIPQASLGNGQAVTVRAPAAGVGILHLDINAQVVLFSGAASGRFSLDGGADATLAQAEATAYSTAGSPAQCPAGSADAGTKLTPISSGFHYVGISGGLTAATVGVQGLSLKAFCATKTTSCLVGKWTTTSFHATLPGLFSEQGATGATMRIGPDGSIAVDFNPMAPIVFTGISGIQGAGPIVGHFTFGGQVTGRVQLPNGPATTGVWQPVGGTLNYSTLTVTVQITSPISRTIGPMSIGQLASSFGAGSSAVNGHPFSSGAWHCSGNTLSNQAPAGTPAAGTWTWTRTG